MTASEFINFKSNSGPIYLWFCIYPGTLENKEFWNEYLCRIITKDLNIIKPTFHYILCVKKHFCLYTWIGREKFDELFYYCRFLEIWIIFFLLQVTFFSSSKLCSYFILTLCHVSQINFIKMIKYRNKMRKTTENLGIVGISKWCWCNIKLQAFSGFEFRASKKLRDAGS